MGAGMIGRGIGLALAAVMLWVDPAVAVICATTAGAEAKVTENEIATQRAIAASGGIIVSGLVDGVESVWGQPTVKLVASNPYLPAHAVLKKSEVDRAATLKRRDRVHLRCETAKSVVGLALYECVFSEPCKPVEAKK